jgi:hypothetical protein
MRTVRESLSGDEQNRPDSVPTRASLGKASTSPVVIMATS